MKHQSHDITALETIAGLSEDTQPVKTGMREDFKTLQQVQDEYIEKIYDICGGHIFKTAGILDVSPSTIYRWRARKQKTS